MRLLGLKRRVGQVFIGQTRPDPETCFRRFAPLALVATGVLLVGCSFETSVKYFSDEPKQSQTPTKVMNPPVKSTPSASQSLLLPPANTQTDSEREPTITYFVVKGARFFDILVARIGSREHTILGEVDDMCLDLPDQRDFDGDGTEDALVFQSPACRGNVAPGLLFFISGNTSFQRSSPFRGHQPRIEAWEGQWSVITNSNRYILRDGKALLVEEH